MIRPVTSADRGAWQRMRQDLWLDKEEHASEIERFFAGELREPLEVLMAFDDEERAIGFIELSIRPYAEGCATNRVAFIEGWYVEPSSRQRGVGATLVKAAEAWGRAQGCIELGSDTEVENLESAAAHRALGFEDAGVIRCFIKPI
jgi:aminoglycoside 6'-N-acetyltransferase I